MKVFTIFLHSGKIFLYKSVGGRNEKNFSVNYYFYIIWNY